MDTPVTGIPAVTLTVDEQAHAVLVAALDLYQRVQMGQWTRVAEVCTTLLGDQAGPFTQAAEALQEVRCRYARDEALQAYPDAFLGVLEAGSSARVAYDLWHALGGGMQDRQSDRWSGAYMTVERAETATAAADS